MSHLDTRAALGRVMDGRIDVATHDEAEALWVRLATEGKVVARVQDSGRGEHQVRAALIAHPDLPAGTVYAVVGMGSGPLTTYRCLDADARLAVADPASYNL